MELAEILAILQAVRDTGIAEFGMVKGDFRLRIKQHADVVTVAANVPPLVAQPVAPVALAVAPALAPAAPVAAVELAKSRLTTINSPMVGTFYRSPSPDAASFIDIGDVVKVGQTVCIIEAMKLMNELEAETTGRVVRFLVSNGDTVEFGQPLVELEPA